MKATYILLIFLSTTCFSQKLQLVFGIGPTYSITNDNINYTIAPSYLPTSTIEDPRLSEKYETKSIDWIQNKNYFGIEPYCRIGYKLGETFQLGLGFFGRHRQLRYDVYLPTELDIALYSHAYKLDYNFIATTIDLNFKLKDDINVGINIGFNYPLNKLDEYYIYDQIINQFDIRESVRGQVKQAHNGASFTLNPLFRLDISKYLNDKICFGFSIEKQIDNDYGSDIRIIDAFNSETVLSGSVIGRDLTFGIHVGYRISL